VSFRVHFEIVHDFEIPLDALELAVLSPDLFAKLKPRLKNIEDLRQTHHELEGGVLRRTWGYQASVKVPVPVFARKVVTREMLGWDESSTYDIKKHAAAWTIHPRVKADWRKYFQAEGKYRLVTSEVGKTRRIVEGELFLRVPIVQKLGERAILGEVRRMFDAEAETLKEMATLV
jgi:hypothetical protein